MANISTIYQEEKQQLLDENYEKYLNRNIKELQKEYRKAQKNIKKEIADWYLRMDDIKKANPNFQFSELKHLEDLQKQINLILNELAVVEETILTNTLKELYVTDYLDLNKLHTEYGLLELNTPIPQFNQMNSIRVLETYISMPIINETVKDLAKKIDVEFVGDAISGKWFSTRIMERAEKLGYSIENKIRQGIIRGDSYTRIADSMSKELDVSFRSAKTLVRTEMAVVENKSEVHQAMKLGQNAVKWVAYHGSDNGYQKNVCEVCRSLDGKIFPLEQVKATDLVAHPNCRLHLTTM